MLLGEPSSVAASMRSGSTIRRPSLKPTSVRSRLAPLCSDVRGTGRRTYCITAFGNSSSERFDCDISPRIGSTSPPSLVLVNTPARRQAAWPSEACPAVAESLGGKTKRPPSSRRAPPSVGSAWQVKALLGEQKRQAKALRVQQTKVLQTIRYSRAETAMVMQRFNKEWDIGINQSRDYNRVRCSYNMLVNVATHENKRMEILRRPRLGPAVNALSQNVRPRSLSRTRAACTREFAPHATEQGQSRISTSRVDRSKPCLNKKHRPGVGA